MKARLVIGSRGSKLALTQAEWVRSRLRLLNFGADIQIEVIKTSGDVKNDPLSVIGGKGVFTKELEDALLDERIDIAVHSLKDLPTILPDNLTIAAICEREDARDALIVGPEVDEDHHSLERLPLRAVVGTSSPRRMAQLKHLRNDIVIHDLRGNVDTRLRKLDERKFDALILAAAGLHRLGLERRITSYLSPEQMVPAVGQGALGIETRANDEATIAAVSNLNHEVTRLSCLAERALLRELGGGCQLPIAGHAIIVNHELRLDGLVAACDGSKLVKGQLVGSTSDAEDLGKKLASRLLESGANDLLATA
jgi:hydroxymethylbilane synthase